MLKYLLWVVLGATAWAQFPPIGWQVPPAAGTGGGGGVPAGCTITAGGTTCTVSGATIGGAVSSYDITTGVYEPVGWTGGGTTSPVCTLSIISAHDVRCSVAGGGAQGAPGPTGPAGTGGGSVFTGSVATATTGIGGTATNPTFSCADQSVKSPIRFEPVALAANVASVTFSSCPAGARFEIRWLQDGTGGRTVTYGGSTVGTCAIIAGANIDTLQPLVVDSTGVVNADGSCSTQAGTTSLVAGTGIAISGTFPNQTVGLATEAADTVVMNATGGTAAPTPVVMPTCTTGANLYNTSTHSWSCVSVGGSSSTFTSSAFSSTPTLTCVANNNNTFKMTLTGNVTSITMASCTAGYAITFYWCQDATGNRTLPPSPTSFTGFFTVGSTLSKCSSQEFGYDGTTFFAKTSGVINQ